MSDKPLSRSEQTREKILLTAEQLFARYGIEAVSLIDINKAAEQRNRNASQYHFGNKEGLVQAILDKHLAPIHKQRETLLARLDAKQPDPADIISAFVDPVAARMFDDSGRAFICINSQLVAAHTHKLFNDKEKGYQIGQLQSLIEHLGLLTTHLPTAIAHQRAMLASVLLFNGLADYVQLSRLDEKLLAQSVTQSYIATVKDAILATLRTEQHFT